MKRLDAKPSRSRRSPRRGKKRPPSSTPPPSGQLQGYPRRSCRIPSPRSAKGEQREIREQGNRSRSELVAVKAHEKRELNLEQESRVSR